MDQHLPDPNRPLTVSILRAALEQLEAAGYGDTPISLYADGGHPLIQAHNIAADTSAPILNRDPKLGFASTWDPADTSGTITNFVVL